MVSRSTQWWEWFERWSATLFLAAGVLVVVFAATEAARVFADRTSMALRAIGGPGGFILAFLGLLGLYPGMATRTPRLARIGAVFAALGAVGFGVSIVATIGEFAGVLPAQPVWTPAYLALIFSGTLIGFTAIAVAIFQTDVYSQRVGLLLLVLPVSFLVVLAFNLGLPDWVAPVVASVQALSLLALGYVHRTEDGPTEQATSLDTTA